MVDENVSTEQPAPEDPGVDPGESTTSDQTPSHNASTSAQSVGTTLDGTAPDLVQAGASGAVPPPVTGPAQPPYRESIGAATVRSANDPVYMDQLRSIDPQNYAYMVAVRDGRTSDPRSLNLGSYIQPSTPVPTVNGASMNGTTNGTTHLNGATSRTLNGPTPETRREVHRPSFSPGDFPPHDEPGGLNRGGMRRTITPGVAATGGRLPDNDAERIEQLQRQREGADDDDNDEDGAAED